MSNVDAPDVNSGETNNPDLLAEQSGMPNMSSTKTFTVDTNMQVNGDLDVTGTVTATSFIGDGSQLTGISGGTGGGGLDSAAVTLLVDSDYVQARETPETPQDFAYSSLTGAPTALSSFTNDTNYITAADIPTTVDSDYVQARVTLDGVGLDSAGVTALVDSDYVAARAPAASGGLDSAGVQTLIDADLVGSGLDAVQIGLNSIASGSRSISIGPNAAATNQNNIAIGNSAGDAGSDQSTIAIGQLAKGGNQTGDTGSVAIGQGAGQYVQGPYTVAIGMNAGRGGGNTALRQQSGAVAAGYQSGYSEQGENGIAIGREAGWSAQGDNSIAIGYLTGKSGQGANNISINATGAAVNRLDQYGIDIRTTDSDGRMWFSKDSDWNFGATVNAPAFVGDGSGLTNLPSGGGLDSAAVIATMNEEFKITTNQVEIGSGAAATNGAPVAIGRDALAKWTYAVAIGQGAEAGNSTKTADVAIGFQAIASGSESIAIGRDALANQISSLAIGNDAEAQGVASIAIGKDAKNALSADYSIVMGENTTINNSKSIALNASGSPLSLSGSNSIDIRTSASGSLTYDTTNDWTFGAGVTMTDLTASGATVVFSNLPTTDPVNAGQLWNDGGTLKVSAG